MTDKTCLNCFFGKESTGRGRFFIKRYIIFCTYHEYPFYSNFKPCRHWKSNVGA